VGGEAIGKGKGTENLRLRGPKGTDLEKVFASVKACGQRREGNMPKMMAGDIKEGGKGKKGW